MRLPIFPRNLLMVLKQGLPDCHQRIHNMCMALQETQRNYTSFLRTARRSPKVRFLSSTMPVRVVISMYRMKIKSLGSKDSVHLCPLDGFTVETVLLFPLGQEFICIITISSNFVRPLVQAEHGTTSRHYG